MTTYSSILLGEGHGQRNLAGYSPWPAGFTHSSTRGLRPPEQLERPAGFPSSDKTRPNSLLPTLQGLIPSAQRLVWAAKQALGKAALGALFA